MEVCPEGAITLDPGPAVSERCIRCGLCQTACPTEVFQSEVHSDHHLLGRMAIKGYDTVAYFKAGKALKGTESLTFPWHGMTWHFSTKENRDLFAAGPEKYAPQ